MGRKRNPDATCEKCGIVFHVKRKTNANRFCSIICALGKWDEGMESQLKALWPTKSAAQIGAKIGVSKDAVIGKAHRMKLPAKAPLRSERVPA